MRWIWQTYLANPEQQKDWRAAPILADLKGVAPAHLIVGSLDPLLDDSHNLAAKLKEAGVPCDADGVRGHQSRLYPLRQADRHGAPRRRRLRRRAEGGARLIGSRYSALRRLVPPPSIVMIEPVV